MVQGKVSGGIKDSTFFRASLLDHVKSDLNCSALRCSKIWIPPPFLSRFIGRISLDMNTSMTKVFAFRIWFL